jgi:hypothetical protein
MRTAILDFGFWIRRLRQVIPRLRLEHASDRQRRRQRVRGSRESAAYGIADGLEDLAVVRLDRFSKQRVVGGECGRHRLRVLLPQRRAAFDIRKKEGDRPAGSGERPLDRLRRQRQPIDRQLGPRRLDERRALVGRNRQALGQPLGDLGGRAQLVGLDLADGDAGAADMPRQRILSQVERLAPPPQPVAERGAALHAAILPSVIPRYRFLYRSLYRKPLSLGGLSVM